MVRRNGFISLTGLMLALGLLLLYLGLGLTAGQRSRSHQAVDGLAREMALDMQQVRQRCVGNNQSNGCWKLVLEEKRYVLQEGYIRVKERPYPPGLQVTKGDVRFAVDGRPPSDRVVIQGRTYEVTHAQTALGEGYVLWQVEAGDDHGPHVSCRLLVPAGTEEKRLDSLGRTPGLEPVGPDPDSFATPGRTDGPPGLALPD